MKRLTFLTLAATLLATPLLALAQGAAFPERPVTLVIPFPPGGPTDAMARTLAAEMQPLLGGQPMVVDNRGGAGGNIGADFVARAKADGHTLLFGTSGPLAINVSLFRKISYDPVKSFEPVIGVGALPNILIVNPKLPVKTVQELIAYDKAHPRELSYSSSGNGASSHLAGVMFNGMAGTDFQHVPYKGTGPALTGLMAGDVSMSFTDVLTALPFVRSGQLRALGMTTATRSQALPDLPTVAEQGLPGFDVSVFFGIVAPAGTPPERIAALNKAFVQALDSPKVKTMLESQGLQRAPSTAPEALGRFIGEQVTKWQGVVRQSGAQLD
jgi:tripartite-type tricarboxylate transporter receptor subunit TctC